MNFCLGRLFDLCLFQNGNGFSIGAIEKNCKTKINCIVMFCFQCQETAKNTGCVSVGVCGKNEDLSSLFDDLIFDIIELAAANNYLRQKNAGDLAASR